MSFKNQPFILISIILIIILGNWPHLLAIGSSDDHIGKKSPEQYYINAVADENSDSLMEYIANFPRNDFAALAACRYILLELKQGGQLELLVNNLNQLGLESHIIQLYSGTRTKTESLPRAVFFPKSRIRMIIKQNYQSQLDEDPTIQYYLDYGKCCDIPFDAFHLIARKDFYKVKDNDIQYFVSRTSNQDYIKSNFARVQLILKDLSSRLGYKSSSEAISKQFFRDLLINQRITIFCYDSSEFKQTYNLKKSGWAYPRDGLIYIDTSTLTTNQYLEQILNQFTHIMIGGNPENLLHPYNRWFDCGFSNWCAYSYLKFRSLNPQGKTQKSNMTSDFQKVKENAQNLQRASQNNYLKLKSVNKMFNDPKNLDELKEADTLALSLMVFIIETQGIPKLIDLAGRISHKGQNLTERCIHDVLGLDYLAIEQKWNRWLSN
jgi:hypothetical protein